MRKLFDGIATALVTPFRKNKVDYKAFAQLINRQINMQVDALVIIGTTGEFSTLSYDERREVVVFTLKTVANRVPVIFGIGGNDPSTVISLGKFIKDKTKEFTAKKVGVMLTAPYYNKATQDGIFQFFKIITNAVKLPTIAYNVPGRAGINIEPATMARISQLTYVHGIKEASGNIGQIAEVVALCPHTPVYGGDDALALPCYAVGCRGTISVASNIDVAPVKEIYTLYKKGKPAVLQVFQNQLPLYRSLFRAVNPIPIKYELSELGLIKNELRLPLTPL